MSLFRNRLSVSRLTSAENGEQQCLLLSWSVVVPQALYCRSFSSVFWQVTENGRFSTRMSAPSVKFWTGLPEALVQRRMSSKQPQTDVKVGLNSAPWHGVSNW